MRRPVKGKYFGLRHEYTKQGTTPQPTPKLFPILTHEVDATAGCGVLTVLVLRVGVRHDRFPCGEHESPNSRPLLDVSRGLRGVRPGIDVANRIGHTQRPVLRHAAGKAAQV